MSENKREYRMDNLKVFLTFFVIMGHLLEGFQGENVKLIYLIIYSFHMPAFVFITGYFAKEKPKQIIGSILFPYVIYQILYHAFECYVLHETKELQFMTPYWLLWYLVAYFVWMLLLPIFEGETLKKQIIHLCFTFVLALAIGYDQTIQYKLSLSRIIVFLPFFLLGYYRVPDRLVNKLKGRKTTLVCCVLMIISSLFYMKLRMPQLHVSWFYHTLAYESGSYTVWIRMMLLIVAMAWIFLLVLMMPNIKLGIISAGGKYTLPAFLLHGFVIKYLQYKDFFRWSESVNILISFGITIVLCIIFGNKYTDKLFRFTYSGQWWKEQYHKIRMKLFPKDIKGRDKRK